ncbi:MAG TPA: Sec-independent protein translocase protein TatB [Thermoanaerobaculia bacterium]|nr:Sec-independent protein translocase protein TatB [Thermoanaerobaculia bacterium]
MGNLGFGELLMVFAVALVVFGPRKLPEIGRTIGGALREFRRATNDLKNTLEEEVRVDEVKKSLDSVRQTAASALAPVPETVNRSSPGHAAPAAETTAPATPERSAASE